MFDKNLMKLPGMRGVMMALLALALLQAACVAGQAWALTGAICAIWEGSGLTAAVPGLAAFAACFALLHLVRFGQETMLDRVACERAAELRAQVLAGAFDEHAMLAQRFGTTRVGAVATDGIDDVETYVRIIPPKIVGMAAISIPLLVCAFVVDWVSGVILAIMFPVIIFFMIVLGRQARAYSERQYAVYTRLTNRFMDTLRGLPVIKAFGAARAEEAQVHENSEAVRVATVRTLRTATLSSVVLDLCATFGVAAVAIMLAFRLMDGSVGLSTGLLALILAPEYFAPIRAFANDYHASLDGKNALSEVLEMLDARGGADVTADAEDDGEGAAGTGAAGVAESTAGSGAAGDAGRADNLELVGVEYRYEGGESGIGPVSLSVEAPCKVGIVGRSGAGKSTLAGLIAGFLAPTGGRALVNGKPADLTSRAWKDQVRYIPQSPYVFRATLADNIRFYNPGATREQVERAASDMGLGPLVDELPDGLDTLVGEGARGLSGGEAHRVALARVLLDDRARVLVFDEPTAHLDVETERDLKEPMLRLMQGRLVFFATHRLHWMDDMDVVVKLENGRVESSAGAGTPSRDAAGQADAGCTSPDRGEVAS